MFRMRSRKYVVLGIEDHRKGESEPEYLLHWHIDGTTSWSRLTLMSCGDLLANYWDCVIFSEPYHKKEFLDAHRWGLIPFLKLCVLRLQYGPVYTEDVEYFYKDLLENAQIREDVSLWVARYNKVIQKLQEELEEFKSRQEDASDEDNDDDEDDAAPKLDTREIELRRHKRRLHAATSVLESLEWYLKIQKPIHIEITVIIPDDYSDDCYPLPHAKIDVDQLRSRRRAPNTDLDPRNFDPPPVGMVACSERMDSRCPLHFATMIQMQNHRRIHFEVECPYKDCAKGWVVKKNFNLHREQNHLQLTHPCTFCSEHFKKDVLRKHVKKCSRMSATQRTKATLQLRKRRAALQGSDGVTIPI